MSSPRQDLEQRRREAELDEALRDLDETLDKANGTCKRKIATRTTRIRRRLVDLAEEPEE